MIEAVVGAVVTLLLAAIAGIVWLVRLEGGHNLNVARLDRVEEQIDQHIDKDEIAHAKMLDTLTDIKESTAQIKGYLSIPGRKKDI